MFTVYKYTFYHILLIFEVIYEIYSFLYLQT